MRLLLVERREADVLFAPLQHTLIGLWEFDLQTNHTRWNSHMHALTGLTTPVSAARWIDYVHPDDRALVEHSMQDTMTLGRFRGVPHRFLRPDGAAVWLVSFGTVLRDTAGTPTQIVGATLDFGMQQRQEQQLASARRLESMGQLTAGITHNFNNLLSVILPTLELVASGTTGEVREAVDEARHAADRARDLVHQIMAFSKKRETSATTERVDALVGRVVSMVQRFFERGYVVEFEPGAPGAAVHGNGAQLEQAVMNLLVNARDALRDGRTETPLIRVTTALGAPAAIAGLPSAEHVVTISVRDNGPGIPIEVQGRLFEPFFTTKGPEKGTGLGLATVLATARAHGGTVRFESSAAGTLFEIVLPCAAQR